MRRVFLSFHYANDNSRVQQIKNMGQIEGQAILSSNDWERVKQRGDAAIERWINEQMNGRSCVVVLIGSGTANRKWINYEITHAWESGKYIIGLRIHKLKNLAGFSSPAGDNPFAYIKLNNGKTLADYVPCINPPGTSSTEAYAWIKDNIEAVIDKAVKR